MESFFIKSWLRGQLLQSHERPQIEALGRRVERRSCAGEMKGRGEFHPGMGAPISSPYDTLELLTAPEVMLSISSSAFKYTYTIEATPVLAQL